MRRNDLLRLHQPIIQLILTLLCAGVARAQSARGTWDPQFTLPPGLNGPVYALASAGNTLYVGGAFTRAGHLPANGIARWDGTNWSTLGNGVDGEVLAIAFSGTDLFVGGRFHTVSGLPATNLARWDGTTWHDLAGGVGGIAFFLTPAVNALYATGTDLYVGGQFILAGDVPATNLARWDGTAWHDLGGGVYLASDFEGSPGGNVQAITGDGTNLYVGGMFIHAGDTTATNLASWDGTAWHALGDCTGGVQQYTFDGDTGYGAVSALALQSGNLCVGGDFAKVAGLPARNLAQWNGANWQNIGDVLGGAVKALVSDSGNLYVAGNFTNAGGVNTTNAAIWNHGVWSPLNAQLPNAETLAAVQPVGGQLYVGGNFSLLTGVSAGNLARRVGPDWLALGTGLGNSLGLGVTALAGDGTDIYATGYFGTAGVTPVTALAQWNGTNWSAVGLLPAADGAVFGNAVAVSGSNIFLAGSFTISEAAATGLAYWNGVSWNSPGGPLTNVSVYQLLTVGNSVYASGFFVDASSNQFGPLSVWDGARWTNLGPGDDFSTDDDLATDGTNLYTARTIYSSTTFDYEVQVERWDGTNLIPLGDRLPALRASALAVSGANLYLAGSVTTNNYSPALYTWDGTAWQPMPATFQSNDFISSLVISRGKLFAAGTFSTINGQPANSIAEWTGANWLTLSNGVSSDPNGVNPGYIAGMVALGRKIFVGGQFTSAGGVDSGNFASWDDTPQISLQVPRQSTNSSFTFNLVGQPGDQLEIQSSTTLSTWTHLDTLTLTNTSQPFTDTPATNSSTRYYRARLIE